MSADLPVVPPEQWLRFTRRGSKIAVSAVYATPGEAWLKEEWEVLGRTRTCCHFAVIGKSKAIKIFGPWPSEDKPARLSFKGRLSWEMARCFEPGELAPFSGDIEVESGAFLSSQKGSVEAGEPFPEAEGQWAYTRIHAFEAPPYPSQPAG